jgi:hypothetical protein
MQNACISMLLTGRYVVEWSPSIMSVGVRTDGGGWLSNILEE